VVGIIFLFVGTSIIPSGTSTQTRVKNIITVDDEPGDADYTTIKEAVNHSNPGDTIEVYSGIYYEHNITIEKEEITLKGIPYELGNGSDTGKPFINGEGKDDLIDIKVKNVMIDGFRMENGDEYACSILGIHKGADNCIISNNDISNTVLYCIGCSSSNNKILYNNVSHSTMRGGIGVGDECINNTIVGNIVSNVAMYGIFVWNGDYNFISNNMIYQCGIAAICIIGSHNTIERNHIEDNIYGIQMSGNLNIVKQNNFIDNDKNAILSLDLYTIPFHNRWFNNYWDEPRILPYPIFGTVLFLIPWVQFDLHPALKPFDIS
jgi:parallel beta-helix repeat protein